MERDRVNNALYRMAAFIFGFTLLFGSSIVSAASERPNIVFMMTDNFGWGELGIYGGGTIRGAETPRLDEFAQEGIRLLNFNVEVQCTPTRSALMTGRHPIRSGTTKVIWGQLYGLVQWEITLAEVLSRAGYSTGHFGKWHLGDSPGRYPTDQGFDEWYGIPNTSLETLFPGQFQYDPAVGNTDYIMEGRKGETSRKIEPYDLQARRKIDATVVEKTINFIKRKVKKKEPFFAYVPFTQPHVPSLPHENFDGYTGNGEFADVLAEIDFRAGQILDSIDELGIRNNTIVIWTSDNGPDFVLPWPGSAGPWRGYVNTATEGGIRTPFMIRWPGKVKAGRVSNEIVHIVDIFPTLTKLVGENVPGDRIIDGIDQGEFFFAGTKKSAREDFPIFFDEIEAYKWRNWKVHFSKPKDILESSETRKYPWMYNVMLDPTEERDLFGEGRIEGFWILPHVGKRINEFKESLVQEPPIKVGTEDPYVPAKVGPQ